MSTCPREISDQEAIAMASGVLPPPMDPNQLGLYNPNAVPKEYQEFFALCERIAFLAVRVRRDPAAAAELANKIHVAQQIGPPIGVTTRLYQLVMADLIALEETKAASARPSTT